MSDKDIGLRIKELIDYFCHGNNSIFARAIGTSEANVRNYLNGRQPKFETLYLIADKFEISCDWLIQGEGSMIKESQSDRSFDLAREEPMSYEKIDLRDKSVDRDINQIIPLKDNIINTLKELTETLEEQSRNYKTDCEALRQDNKDLRTDVQDLRKDNMTLRKEINRLRKEQGKHPIDFIRDGDMDLHKR